MSDDRPPDTDEYDHTIDHEGDDVRAATDRERTTDAVDRTDRETTAAATRGDARAEEPSDERREESDSGPAADTGDGDGDGGDGRDGTGSGGRSDRFAFWVSALFGLALAVGAVALVSGRAPFFEDLLRVRPTVEGGGIGADWLVGNTGPVLEAAIVLVHFADVVMGIFILLMVFVHWAAFRRLAARMQPPAGSARSQETTAATDGGEPSEVDRRTQGVFRDDERASLSRTSRRSASAHGTDDGVPDSSSSQANSSPDPHEDTTRSSGGERIEDSRSTSEHGSEGGEPR